MSFATSVVLQAFNSKAQHFQMYSVLFVVDVVVGIVVVVVVFIVGVVVVVIVVFVVVVVAVVVVVVVPPKATGYHVTVCTDVQCRKLKFWLSAEWEYVVLNMCVFQYMYIVSLTV